jgi:hypothetical protein
MSTPTTGVRELFRQLLSPEFLNGLQPPSGTTVYTPYIVVWLFIFQRLHANASLARAVAEFLTQFPQHAVPKAQHGTGEHTSANTGAYSQARTRLDTALARTVADHVTATLLEPTPRSDPPRHVFILDGTTVQLTHTAELCAAFPPASNQYGPSHWPILHLLVAHELNTGLALRPEFGPMYGPHAQSELALTRRLIPRLPPGALILADRNFGVFAVAHAAQSSGRGVVVRLTQARFRSMRKTARLEEPGRWALTWRPTPRERQSHGLDPGAQVTGWLHEVRVNPKLTLWLFATGPDSGRELAALYRRRLDVETDIRNVKQTLAMDRLTGQGSEMVEKELVLGVLAYNLVNQVRRLAAAQAGVEPRRLGFAGVWNLVQALLTAMADGSSEEDWEARFEQVLRWVAQRKLPRRATPRSYPRTIIPKRARFPKRKPTPIHKPA